LDITLPGTHDSGAYVLYDDWGPGFEDPWVEELVNIANDFDIPVYSLVKGWSLAQNMSFYDQMMGKKITFE
jgi:hypothetical protein